ncbi:hypothetical protein JCM5350_004390 [Sporobolomyces pararoseus]
MKESMDLTEDEQGQLQAQLDQLTKGLNEAQREAVTATSKGGLFVAGVPGCGKTKTLSSRVGWLIRSEGLDPSRLVVVTFTNKAANEMKERLSLVLGEEVSGQLIFGTFHSICARYLRRYGSLVSLSPNFSILDRDDAGSVIKRVISNLTDFPSGYFSKWKPSQFLDKISSAKSKSLNPESYRINQENCPNSTEREWVFKIWDAYRGELKRTNAVDFDDLLIFGHELFRKHPHVAARIQSVLVDEFQDTSVTQYELAKYMAKAGAGSITVVGDPDQSIYGWRNAEVENLNRMIKDFNPCRQIFLEENYRSTNSILQLALAITTLTEDLGSELVSYRDFAILLRAGYQSLSIELALQKAGIPCIFRGGHKFFERTEVKDILSYLQLVANPHHTAALERVLNTPKRSIGDKSLKEIFQAAHSSNQSPWSILVAVADGSDEGVTLSATAKKGVKSFVGIIKDCRRKLNKLKSVAELIDLIIDKTGYENYLKKTFKDKSEDKLLNVQELKNYAVLVAKEGPNVKLETGEGEEDEKVEIVDPAPVVSTPKGKKGKEKAATTVKGEGKGKGKGKKKVVEVDESENEEQQDEQAQLLSSSALVNDQLDAFLSAASLATDHDTQQAATDGKIPKVVISTVHSAKGLEWPCVFVPGVEDGTFPFYRASTVKEIDEERRLLYVAITRAQTHCTLSWVRKRMGGGTARSKTLSPFLDDLPKRFYVSSLPEVTEQTRIEVAQVIRRQSRPVAAEKDNEIENMPSIESEPPRTSESKRSAPDSTLLSSPETKKIKT